jgi:predicted DNA repair protein MutK
VQRAGAEVEERLRADGDARGYGADGGGVNGRGWVADDCALKANRTSGVAAKFEKEIDVNWIICVGGSQGANRGLTLWNAIIILFVRYVL